jgi:hypothetical protein
MKAGDKAMERRDHPKALGEYVTAARLALENIEVVYWHAVALVNMQRPAALSKRLRMGPALGLR